ncbi:TPA: hypothetical protein BOS_12176 [Bos taurus]|nr:TPA: hypothetical protein BOS_12176 [Bos taurus]
MPTRPSSSGSPARPGLPHPECISQAPKRNSYGGRGQQGAGGQQAKLTSTQPPAQCCPSCQVAGLGRTGREALRFILASCQPSGADLHGPARGYEVCLAAGGEAQRFCSGRQSTFSQPLK